MVNRLVLELTSCARYFEGSVKGVHIDRLIFLAGQTTEKNLCSNIVQLATPARAGSDRRRAGGGGFVAAGQKF